MTTVRQELYWLEQLSAAQLHIYCSVLVLAGGSPLPYRAAWQGYKTERWLLVSCNDRPTMIGCINVNSMRCCWYSAGQIAWRKLRLLQLCNMLTATRKAAATAVAITTTQHSSCCCQVQCTAETVVVKCSRTPASILLLQADTEAAAHAGTAYAKKHIM